MNPTITVSITAGVVTIITDGDIKVVKADTPRVKKLVSTCRHDTAGFYSDDELSKLIEWHKQGKSGKFMARQLKRSTASVYTKVSQLRKEGCIL